MGTKYLFSYNHIPIFDSLYTFISLSTNDPPQARFLLLNNTTIDPDSDIKFISHCTLIYMLSNINLFTTKEDQCDHGLARRGIVVFGRFWSDQREYFGIVTLGNDSTRYRWLFLIKLVLDTIIFMLKSWGWYCCYSQKGYSILARSMYCNKHPPSLHHSLSIHFSIFQLPLLIDLLKSWGETWMIRKLR